MRVRAVTFALGTLLLALVSPATANTPKSVLLLYDEDHELPGLSALHQSLRTVFRSALEGGVEFYTESMNLSRFREKTYDGALREHYRQKYAGKRLDLIVGVMGPALDFLLRHGAAIFPGTPIVFCGADESDIAGKTLGSNVTGVLLKRVFGPTLATALRLQPDTRNVFVVGGTSRFDRHLEAAARRELTAFEDRVRISYLTGVPMDDLLKTLAGLPPRSAILYLTVFADGAGRAFVPHDALSLITRVASAPVYVVVDQFLGRGTVGGHVHSLDAHGRHAAEIGVRVLRGEAPASIPIRERTAHADVFDARQLGHWKLDERRLPPGSVVRFRQPSIWAQYRWYVVGGVTLLVVQASLIVGLLMNHAQRRRGQRALAERLRFESLFAELSATFLTHRPSEIDGEIEPMLQRVVEAMDFDRAILAEWVEGKGGMRLAHSWTRAGVASPPKAFEEAAFPWIGSQLIRRDVVRVERLDALPQDAGVDRRSLEALGIRSFAAVPLLVDGSVVGALGFSSLRQERAWPAELVPRLQLLADVFANVLARVRADSTVRESHEHRRHAEDEARRQREELAHALRITTLSELTASLAHELSQPLTAITTNAQAGRRLLRAGASPDFEELLGDIGRDAIRAGAVIQRVRILLRKGERERQPLDLNGLVAGVERLVRHTLERAQISVRLSLAEGLPPVPGDAIQLQQVILNLLLNAVEALGSVQTGSRELDVATRHDPRGVVVVTVRDTGIGVAESELAGIFEPFVTSKAHGLGMGLSISRSIVEAHQGRIWATRNPEQGLTVHVELPL